MSAMFWLLLAAVGIGVLTILAIIGAQWLADWIVARPSRKGAPRWPGFSGCQTGHGLTWILKESDLDGMVWLETHGPVNVRRFGRGAGKVSVQLPPDLIDTLRAMPPQFFPHMRPHAAGLSGDRQPRRGLRGRDAVAGLWR